MKTFKLSGLIILMLLFTACASTPSPTDAPSAIDARVQVLERFWGTDIRITEVMTTINSSRLMVVQVTGVNEDSDYLQLEYRVEWFDQEGMLIPSKMTHWVQFPAFEETEFRLKVVAPKPSAADFKILIREVNN